jgi:hypothetical protein
VPSEALPLLLCNSDNFDPDLICRPRSQEGLG